MIRVVRRRRRMTTFEAGRQTYTVGAIDRFRLDQSEDTRAARRLIESVPISPAPAGAATSVIDASSGAVVGSIDGAPVPRTIPLLPGEQTVARRVKFGLANACTIASLMLGMTAIFLSMHGDVRFAALALLGCVIFDGLDGALARRLGVASPFGAQMDSLVDMCSFGIAAPVVVYASLHGRAPVVLIALACGMIGAGAAIRLARFNVSPKDGRFFCGVPTTMTAAVMGMSVLIGLQLPGPIAVVSVAVLAIAMVSGFPYAKLARIAKLPPWLWVAPLVGFFIDPRITFALLVAAYLMSGPLIWLRQRGDRDAITA